MDNRRYHLVYVKITRFRIELLLRVGLSKEYILECMVLLLFMPKFILIVLSIDLPSGIISAEHFTFVHQDFISVAKISNSIFEY